MSRVGKAPIELPEKVEVTMASGEISVKGPLGTLTQRLTPVVEIEKQDKTLLFKPAGNSRQANAMSGTT
ncbi:MAG: 50S ribosomal protein L6, partial [Betaproteobacteria bacterium]|nr:50S ribosomal protein L6 [Betaproteobacteria bacterium]